MSKNNFLSFSIRKKKKKKKGVFISKVVKKLVTFEINDNGVSVVIRYESESLILSLLIQANVY